MTELEDMGMQEYLDWMDYFEKMNPSPDKGGGSGKRNLLDDETALIATLTG